MNDDVIRNAEHYEAVKKARREALYTKSPDGNIIVDHVRTANVLIRFIQLTPMDKWIKDVMIMRIGNPLINLKPATHMQIALTLGCMESEVREMEEVGTKIVNDYIRRVTQPEFVEKFERDRRNKASVDDTLNKIVNSDNSDR